jgi:hypothetical protein
MGSDHAILVPMGLLALGTIAVGLADGIARAIAIQRNDVSADFYGLFEGERRPPPEARHRNHSHTQHELPIIYDDAGVVIYTSGLTDSTFVALFWSFLPIRLAHAVIHISYNRVIHRAAAFGAGIVVASVIWIRILLLLSNGSAA